MVTSFQGSAIDQMLVEGNAESLYYLLEEKTEDLDSLKVKLTITMGMNKLICSKMKILFKNGKVNTVNAYVKPDARFIPPTEIKADEKGMFSAVIPRDANVKTIITKDGYNTNTSEIIPYKSIPKDEQQLVLNRKEYKTFISEFRNKDSTVR